ncbi:protein FAM83E [Spea bombifrons]|uniref:protein FAM83E n=1 Tax=Spea bombifrons TaxID=233779 RepID=UPI00234B4B40|nr:protein FAM83E [Spea bombifrons]
MANSQLQCLEEDQEFVDLTEGNPDFYYSEKQRTALETLLSSGAQAFQNCIKEEGIRHFLSKEEIISIESSATDSELGKIELEDDSELDDDGSISYWPGKSDVPTPMLDLGWPEGGNWKGITRAEVYTHPPSNNAPHIKVIMRRTIQNATKVIAVVMDVFTDPDIFLDLHEAATRRMIPVYIVLNFHHLPSFLQMAETLGINVRYMENMRVRVISGCTFNTRHLRQVTGKLKEKFLLVDGESVITGTYSFTWSDARLERNLITLLTGEITDTFDNEFRTLFAASRPLQRYDFANKDVNSRSPVPSLAVTVPKEPEMVNHNCQPVSEIAEINANGFSSPKKFNTSGMLQPTDILSAPYKSPLVGVPLSKSVNKITERRTVVPVIEKNVGTNSEVNNVTGAPPFSSNITTKTVNLPDYTIRHRLAACRNFEGTSVNVRNGQESHSALSDILKNVQRSRLSVAKTTGGRPSKSLWDLSQLSQLSGCSGEHNPRQNPLELGEESKKPRWTSQDTPAMLLMRHRAFPTDDARIREPSNPHPSGFKPSAIISPIRLQGQLVHGMTSTALPRPWVNPSRHIRPHYY